LPSILFERVSNTMEIFAALEIIDTELRLVVGEFHNGKLNVLKVEQLDLPHGIKEEAEVIDAIRVARSSIKDKLGVEIESVLLAVPSFGMEKKTKKITAISSSVRLRPDPIQIRDAYKKILATPLEDKLVLINACVSRFVADGVLMRRFPVNDALNELALEADLYCTRSEKIFDYLKAVEKSGLIITDICFDLFAAAKEASLLDQSVNNYILLIKSERKSTSFGLVYNGKIVNSILTSFGYQAMIDTIVEKYGLPEKTAARLLLFNMDFSKEVFEDAPIYMWLADGETRILKENELAELLKPQMEKLVLDLKDTCEPLLSLQGVNIVLCGEGGELCGLDKKVETAFGFPTRAYIPDTLGTRKSAFATCLGMLYTYKDQELYRSSLASAVDIYEYEHLIRSRRKRATSVDDSLTNRFKSMFERRAK